MLFVDPQNNYTQTSNEIRHQAYLTNIIHRHYRLYLNSKTYHSDLSAVVHLLDNTPLQIRFSNSVLEWEFLLPDI